MQGELDFDFDTICGGFGLEPPVQIALWREGALLSAGETETKMACGAHFHIYDDACIITHMLTLEPSYKKSDDLTEEYLALQILMQTDSELGRPLEMLLAHTQKPYLFRHNRLWTMRPFFNAFPQYDWREMLWDEEIARRGGAMLASMHLAIDWQAGSKNMHKLFKPLKRELQWRHLCLNRLERAYALASEFIEDEDVDFSLDSAQALLNHLSGSLSEVQEAQSMIGNWLKTNEIDRLWETVVHGDYHPGNLLFALEPDAVDKEIRVIDFDFARADDPFYDYAYGRVMFAGTFRDSDWNGQTLFHPHLARAFDMGYRGVLEREYSQDDAWKKPWIEVWLGILPNVDEHAIETTNEALVKDLLCPYYELSLALILAFELETWLAQAQGLSACNDTTVRIVKNLNRFL